MKFLKNIFFLFFLFSINIKSQTTDQITNDLKWRNIGPANMMGRIAAIDASNSDYRKVLIASASGGVFKSENAGITWESIFDKYGAGSIGSIKFDQNNLDVIWIGTGESANRNSSAYGDGIYKSIDGGKSFINMGLESTHQIAEIEIHPNNSDVVFAAAIGHLWGYTGERGLFKTIDGGKSWEKVSGGLPSDNKTGCTEIVIHPNNPNIMFAGFYHRLRQPASFISGGENGGLYKSIDGGKSWKKITKGLAKGSSGMIDISIHLNNPDIMVMAYEADENLPQNEPGTGVYISYDKGESWNFLLKHAVRPFYHGQIEIDPIDPNNIYVVSRGFMISNDGGKTFSSRRWRTDGGDDHDMWIAPYDNKIMYLATDQGSRLSIDGGNTWLSHNNMAIGQYYAIGVDMRDPYYVGGGLQDNGLWMTPSNSREYRGILNMHSTWIAEGDGFHTQIDPNNWKTVYTVNHVGFVARQNIETREYTFITPTPETIKNFNEFVDYDYDETRNKYTIDPGEHWFFRERPDRTLLPPQFRFNWSSPFIISSHNSKKVLFGSNYLFQSYDRGDTWNIISPDLTTNDKKLRNTSNGGGLTNSNTGGENHFTIVTISDTPIDTTIIWAGTDDGNVQVTKNNGENWKNVKLNIKKIPKKIWVSRVEASKHAKGRAYVTFDNHRFDDNSPYVYVTENYGETWKNITSNLPKDYSVYVIKEDPINPNLLFVGTEESVYFSYDRGLSWGKLGSQLPTVAIHDLVIHPRDGDLIAGTHGRSIWILDDISPLRNLTADNKNKLFDTRKSTQWIRINSGRKQPYFEFRGKNPPYGAIINFFSNSNKKGEISISNLDETNFYSKEINMIKGINRFIWPFALERNENEFNNYKLKFIDLVKLLQNIATDKKNLEKFDFNNKNSFREINLLRKNLLDKYGMYAGGEKIFGDKIYKNFNISPGKYKITITLENQEVFSDIITVRDDPIKLIN
ncbi:MAG TPA: hypothetical protein EYQ68_04360 [Cytophagales bacterium]|jgi:photosystem II stability/assembly factor-like uncharacterized protein|nr:hypothetical protein [Cytophagales bacterium]